MYSVAMVGSANTILRSFSILPSYQLDNREALTIQLDPAVPLFKVYIKVGYFGEGHGRRGGSEGILYILFALLMFFPMRWHNKDRGPPPLRAKAVLPHNLPRYFEMGCK